MTSVEELDDDAMRRVATRMRENFGQRIGAVKAMKFFASVDPAILAALLKATWIAAREELERQK